MPWRMRIGHYKPTTIVVLEDGRLSPFFESEELRRYHGFPGMTDEDLFCLTFHEFSRSVKVARLDECPLTPREVYDRGAAVYVRAQEAGAQRSRERGKRRRAMNTYNEYCERLYQEWSDGKLLEGDWSEPALRDHLQERRVDFDHAPEPYLAFDGADLTDVETPQIVFLTTNPGNGNKFQTHEAAGGRPSYAELQKELVEGPYRKETSEIGSAQIRIERMREIAVGLRERTGVRGFIQCEVVPFHSGTLPNKRGLAKWLREEGHESALGSYLSALKGFLRGKNIVAIDASYSPASPNWEHWLRFKANLFDFEPQEADKVCLGMSKNKRESTCVFNAIEGSTIRAYYLTQGSNALRDHVGALCKAILDSKNAP